MRPGQKAGLLVVADGGRGESRTLREFADFHLRILADPGLEKRPLTKTWSPRGIDLKRTSTCSLELPGTDGVETLRTPAPAGLVAILLRCIASIRPRS